MSIAARLTVAASVVLALALGLTAAALDRAFRETGLEAAADRLEARVYALLAAAETGPDGRLHLAEPLPDPRMSTPAGGIFAQVRSRAGEVVWRSASAVGTSIEFPSAAAAGVPVLAPATTAQGTPVLALAFTVHWEVGAGEDTVYIFEVAETRDAYETQLATFRRALWGWFAAAAALVVAVQLAVLRWGLAPLRRLAREIRDIEAGRIESLPSAPRPDEIAPVVASLDSLIATGRRLVERHRDALGDLAHSLKTPLAVLRGEAGNGSPPDELRATLAEQVERIDRSVEYHLRRAATGGATVLSRPIVIAAVAARVRDAIVKVHAERGIRVSLDVPEDCVFRADEGDLMEILGNLLDNGCKWAAAEVRLRARAESDDGGRSRPDLIVEVEDDGPGIAPALRETVLARGARAGGSGDGHGIGLAVVRSLAQQTYAGGIEIGDSALGGARVRVRLRGAAPPGGASLPRDARTPQR